MPAGRAKKPTSRKRRAMKDEAAELSSKKLRVVQALSVGQTPSEACKALGLHRSTIYRWLEEPEFRAALNRARRDLHQALQARSMKLVATAMQITEEELKGSNLDATDKVETALKILRGSGYPWGAAPAIGPTDAEALELNDRLAAANRKGASDLVDMLELQRDLDDRADLHELAEELSKDPLNGKRFLKFGRGVDSRRRTSSEGPDGKSGTAD